MASNVALAFDILARDKASKTLTGIGDSAEKTGGRVKGMAKTAIKAFAGIAVARKGLDFGKDAIAGARDAIEIDKQTEAVIKSTGGAAGITAKHVDALSNKLQRQQTISDEVVQTGANLLLTFKGIRNETGKGNDVFDRTVGLAGDMSTALGTDVKSSALQLGKALNDPIKGVSALQRVGVSFTEQQKEQIKTMVASGDTLGAQKLILAELDSQFGGSAAAQSNASKKLGLAWSDFQEVIGRALLPIMDKLIGTFTTVARWAADNPAQFKAVAAVVGGALAVAFTAWAVSAASAAAATIAAAAPVIAITAAVAALAAGIIWAYQNVDIFRTAVDTVASFLTGTVWPAIHAGASFLTGTLVPALTDAAGFVVDFGRQALEVFGQVATFIGDKVGAIVGFFTGTLVPAIQGVIQWYWDVYAAVFGAMGQAAEFVADRVRAIVGFFTDLASSVGNIAKTLWDPISRTFKGVVNAIIDAWNRLDFSIDIRVPGWVPAIGGKGFQVDDVFPDIPRLHTGGKFRAPFGEREGIAMLLNGERVLDPIETVAYERDRGGGTRIVEANFHGVDRDTYGMAVDRLLWELAD